ncbi:MAG TPA: ATP-binding protein, partial [Longimicrobium sp.]|nr:ATP-binding protein [Longimicrobium sp.]
SRAVPIRNERGNVSRWFGTHTDETEQRETVQRLRESEEYLRVAKEQADAANVAKSQFLANMSHELRTPINAIIGYADLLEVGVAGTLTEGQQSYVDRLKSGGQHLIGLVNEILDLAKVEAGEMVVERHAAPVLEAAEAALSLVAPQAAAKGIQIGLERRSCNADALYLGDPDRVRQILVNLLSNAVKFTGEGGRITLRCLTVDAADAPGAGPWISVEVEDTGMGIAPEHLGRVFEPFLQVDDKHTRREGGTGLGLTISRKLARLMGGDLTVKSRPGEGSSFTLLLPAGTQEDVAQDDETGSVEAQVEFPVVVVAYGEDRKTLDELRRQVHPGVRLVGTTNVGEVVALARRERAWLVVLEISGEGDGVWQVAHSLHHVPELARTAVLLLPSIPSSEAGPAAGRLAVGWISLVPKPFSSDQLIRAVSVAAAGSGPDEALQSMEGYDVLIVDDDPDTRHIAAAHLHGAKAEVREALDGALALAEMRRIPPDVVVLDLMMPVMSGFDVLDAMRLDPVLARIPVVVLTAVSPTEAERQLLARTAAGILRKGSHDLGDVAALVLRAAAHARRLSGSWGPAPHPPQG